MTIQYCTPRKYGTLLKPPLSVKQVNVYLRAGKVKGSQQMPADAGKRGQWIIPMIPLAEDPRRKRENNEG